MGNKKYYWLKLKNNFFTDKRIKKLRKIAGGDTYTIIYLKMQLLSLQDEGNLYFENIEETFEEEIALQIDENVEDVRLTIAYLIRTGLLIQNEDYYELTETKNCIGSEVESAERVRKFRERQNAKALLCNGDVTKCNTEIEKDIDIDIEKENNKRKTPTLEEINLYIQEKQLKIDGRQFFDYFTEGNWIDSKGNRVKNWKQKLLTWNKYNNESKQKTNTYEQREYTNLNNFYV